MSGKVLSRAKRREGHSITFCTVLYLNLPCRSLPPYNWTEYPDLAICPNRPFLSHIQTISEKETCLLQHVNTWIVVVIVLVMVVMMIIIIITLTIMIIDCAVPSVT